MRYAIFTVSLPDYTPEQAAAEMKDAGYDGVEWRVIDQRPAVDGHPSFWDGNRCTWPLSTLLADLPRLRAVTESAGLAMPSLGTYVNCERLDEVDTAMRAAAALGVPCLRVGVPAYDGKSPYLKRRDRALAQYHEVAELARTHGVRALIEIHMGNITPSASAAAAFARHFDPRDVGIIHDAGNMVYEGYEQYRLGLEVLGPYLAHVHLKSARWQQSGTRRMVRPPGTPWQRPFPPGRWMSPRSSAPCARLATTVGSPSRISAPSSRLPSASAPTWSTCGGWSAPLPPKPEPESPCRVAAGRGCLPVRPRPDQKRVPSVRRRFAIPSPLVCSVLILDDGSYSMKLLRPASGVPLKGRPLGK